jgi:hypothetical protein
MPRFFPRALGSTHTGLSATLAQTLVQIVAIAVILVVILVVVPVLTSHWYLLKDPGKLFPDIL